MNRVIQRHTVHWKKLLPLLVLLLVGAVCLTATQVRVPCSCYEEQVHAAERMATAFPILLACKRNLGVSPDFGNDPNRTGLIGVEFSEITTTVGSLVAKRTSANPDFAALLVRFLHELALEPKARVVLTLSGSFPALNLAAIVACEELGFELLVFSSVGASSFGANCLEITWLDMETLLARHRVISHRTSFASLGGENDLGESFFGDGKALAFEAIKRNELIPVVMETFDEQSKFKLQKIESFEPCLLINVGGNQLNVGGAGCLLGPGVLTTASIDPAQLGIIGWFLNHDLAVIHLLHVKDLAVRVGLPIDPIPLLSPGESDVYYRTRVHIGWASIILALIGLYVLYLVSDTFRRQCKCSD